MATLAKKHSKKSFNIFGKDTFFARIGFLFIVWVIYRAFVHAPEWFDEVIVKAFVFGIPSWLYARSQKKGVDTLGLSDKRFWHGMFFGLLIGGFYEFVAVLAVLLRKTQIAHPSILNSPM